MSTPSNARRRALADAAALRDAGFWAIDVELDGEGPGSLCAIGVARVLAGAVDSAERWIFRPERVTGRWSPLHGLDPATLTAAPPLDEAFPAVHAKLAEARRLVAYNAAFERRVLRTVTTELGIAQRVLPIHCAFELARAALRLARYRLRDVCEHLGVSLSTPHEPLSDAVATAEVVLALASLRGGEDAR